MKLIRNSDDGTQIIEDEDKIEIPTVGEMLEYIFSNNIPMDAKIVIEHVEDSYLATGGWLHYIKNSYDFPGFEDEFLFAHNGFGCMEDKKYFTIWMHY